MAIQRLNIINNLVSLLQTISSELDDFYTDIGSNVKANDDSIYSIEEGIDAVDVRDISEIQSTDSTENQSLEDRTLRIQINILTKSKTHEYILQAIADVETAIKSDLTLSGNADNIRPVSNKIDIEWNEFVFRGAQIEIDVDYQTETFNAETAE